MGSVVKSMVVRLDEIEPGIVQITLQDKINKNTFSEELVNGLLKAFEVIKSNTSLKVVILTGYDNYFASGGMQEALIAIYEKKIKFTDVNIYSLALDCEIPVISAIQGHAIGGGFVLGLFSDFVVMSRESVYTTNFMKYGFTPGMGATYIVPKKLGTSLSFELLMSAGNYRGADLEKRGIPFPVMPRKEVMSYTYQLAREIADKPRVSLVTLKSHLVKEMREELDAFVQKEVEMHEETFHQEEVRQRISNLFGK